MRSLPPAKRGTQFSEMPPPKLLLPNLHHVMNGLRLSRNQVAELTQKLTVALQVAEIAKELDANQAAVRSRPS